MTIVSPTTKTEQIVIKIREACRNRSEVSFSVEEAGILNAELSYLHAQHDCTVSERLELHEQRQKLHAKLSEFKVARDMLIAKGGGQ